jgi:hypothetical protein
MHCSTMVLDVDECSTCIFECTCSSASSSSTTDINWIGDTVNFDVVFTDKKTKQIRNALGYSVLNGKVLPIDLTNDDHHPSVSAPSTPSTVEFVRVTPPSSNASILYE